MDQMDQIENIKLNVFGMISSFYKEFTCSVIDPINEIYKLYETDTVLDENLLENLLNTCKVHNELQNVSTLINTGEVLGASAALGEIEKMLSCAEAVLPQELFDLLVVIVIYNSKGSSNY